MKKTADMRPISLTLLSGCLPHPYQAFYMYFCSTRSVHTQVVYSQKSKPVFYFLLILIFDSNQLKSKHNWETPLPTSYDVACSGFNFYFQETFCLEKLKHTDIQVSEHTHKTNGK